MFIAKQIFMRHATFLKAHPPILYYTTAVEGAEIVSGIHFLEYNFQRTPENGFRMQEIILNITKKCLWQRANRSL